MKNYLHSYHALAPNYFSITLIYSMPYGCNILRIHLMSNVGFLKLDLYLKCSYNT
jgi:hypothetical protein